MCMLCVARKGSALSSGARQLLSNWQCPVKASGSQLAQGRLFSSLPEPAHEPTRPNEVEGKVCATTTTIRSGLQPCWRPVP